MADGDETTAVIRRSTRRMLLAGEPVDVGKVAAEAGVDRTTVFRRAGRRDVLVADALWSVGEPTWERCLAEVPAGTPGRVAEVMTAFVRYLVAADWFRTFVHRDPQRALRVLTTQATPLQRHVVARVEELVRAEPPVAVDLAPEALAYVLVRVAESFVYADVIAGGEPDADVAHEVFVALLGRRRG